jgi:2-polyprenyl-3-methyl-5-hydroxy-6-metoxy-1,4-benzoquinol methylase
MEEKNNTCPLCRGVSNTFRQTLNYGSRLLACSQCDLHFVSPFPFLDQKFYDQNYFSSWGMTDNIFPEHVQHLKETNMQKHVKNIGKFVPRGNVLEVGCAMGSFLKVADEEGYSVTGIDLSLQACESAQKKVPNAVVCHGTIEGAGFDPESFDVIFMSDLVEHVPDPFRFWEEIYKLLKNNGIVYVITPDPRHWSCVLMGNSWLHFKEEHLVFFPKNTVNWICQEFGFKFIEFSHVVKYTNVAYFSAQTEKFGPKYLAFGISMLSRILPQKLEECLFPIPLGEAQYILHKSV